MGFKEVASLDADVVIALGKKNKETGKMYPKQAEGYYLGTRVVKGKRGDSQLHFLQTEAGNLGLWGTTDLNRKIASVAPGTMVRVTSTGTKPTPNGDMYTYKVERDESNTIEVDIATASASGASAGADEDETEDEGYSAKGGYSGGDEEDTEDEDTEEDQNTRNSAASAALAAKERKAKVEALLKAKSRK